jgi:hypothetical protein
LSLICTYDPYGRTECTDYAGEERCYEGGSYCGESDVSSGPEQITADGSMADRTGGLSASSTVASDDVSAAFIGQNTEKRYTRGCGGIIVGRTFAPHAVAALRKESAVVIL